MTAQAQRIAHDSLIEVQEMRRHRDRFPALKSQPEIDAEAGISGVAYALTVILGGCAAVAAFGIGYMTQGWWLSW